MEQEVTEDNINNQSAFDGSTKLHCLMGDPHVNANEIKKLLRMDPNVNLQNDQGQTGLMLGIINGLRDTDIIFALLNGDADFNLTDKNKNTLLHYCCRFGVVIDIVFEKSDPCTENEQGETALHHVNNSSVLTKLFQHYSNRLPYEGVSKSELFTNLQDYCQNPEELIDKRSVIQMFTNSTEYPIPNDISAIVSYAIKISTENELIKDFLEKALLPYSRDFIDPTNVLDAIKTDDKDIFDAVVQNCNNIKTVAKQPLLLLESLTVAPCHGITFNWDLLQFVPDIDLINIIDEKSGKNSAHYLCGYDKPVYINTRVEYLKELQSTHGDMLTKPDNAGRLPLAYAIENNQSDFLAVFKEEYKAAAGSRIRLATLTSDLLHYAIETKSVKMAKCLIELGFPLSAVDSNLRTSLHKMAIYLKNATTAAKSLACLDQVNCCF